MKEMFKKIPTTMMKPLSQRRRFQKIMMEIGGGWSMKKKPKGLPLLSRIKLSKNHKTRRMN